MDASSLTQSLYDASLDEGHRCPSPQLQDQSPLFRLPPEIRESIWTMALTAYDDLSRPYDIDTHYRRPGYTHAQIIDTQLLLVCRQVYLEARHLPLSVNMVPFWCYRGPRGEPDLTRRLAFQDDVDLEEDDTPWQFERFRRQPASPIHFIKRMQWFVQQYWLECDNFLFATQSPEMSNVEHLTITLRRSDFWNWDVLQPIGLDPRLAVAVTASRMHDTWAKDFRGETVRHHPDSWGQHIQNLPKVQTLTIELECEDFQQKEMDEITKHAVDYWTFPHSSGRFMVSDKTVEVDTWLGPPELAARRPGVPVTRKPVIQTHRLRFSLAA